MEFKKILNKAKETISEKISEVDFKSLDQEAKKIKKTVRTEMEKHGVDEAISKLKVQSVKLSDNISSKAKDIYEKNKDTLEEPVSKVQKLMEKISEHKEEIKWVGGIAIGIIAPVTTLVAATTIYLFSDDEDENVSDEVKKAAEKLQNDIDSGHIIKKESELVVLLMDRRDKTVKGVFINEKLKGKEFKELGIENMEHLYKTAPDEKTKELVKIWLDYEKSK